PGPPPFAINDDDPLLRGGNAVPLISTSVLPDRIRSFFPFQFFNAMQSEVFEHIYGSDHNIVLSAPTASGKTTCFDMAIARGLGKSTETTSFKVRSLIFNRSMLQIVYIGPTNSLCPQKARASTRRLSKSAMKCTPST